MRALPRSVPPRHALAPAPPSGWYLVRGCVEAVLELHNVWMVHHADDLQLAVLRTHGWGAPRTAASRQRAREVSLPATRTLLLAGRLHRARWCALSCWHPSPHLEPLVLQHLLDGHLRQRARRRGAYGCRGGGRAAGSHRRWQLARWGLDIAAASARASAARPPARARLAHCAATTHRLPCLQASRLEHYAKGAVAHHPLGHVADGLAPAPADASGGDHVPHAVGVPICARTQGWRSVPATPVQHSRTRLCAARHVCTPVAMRSPVTLPSNTGSLPLRCSGDSVSSRSAPAVASTARWALVAWGGRQAGRQQGGSRVGASSHVPVHRRCRCRARASPAPKGSPPPPPPPPSLGRASPAAPAWLGGEAGARTCCPELSCVLPLSAPAQGVKAEVRELGRPRSGCGGAQPAAPAVDLVRLELSLVPSLLFRAVRLLRSASIISPPRAGSCCRARWGAGVGERRLDGGATKRRGGGQPAWEPARVGVLGVQWGSARGGGLARRRQRRMGRAFLRCLARRPAPQPLDYAPPHLSTTTSSAGGGSSPDRAGRWRPSRRRRRL